MCRSFVLFLLLALSCSLAAQKYEVQGQVFDTSDHPLSSATVVLLQAADSVIASFGITSNQGNFHLKRIDAGDFILQISYVGYLTYNSPLSIGAKTGNIILDPIKLESVTSALDEVVVTADRIPMMIKKDTIEYSAEAFKTQPADVVEDLLRKLPGVEVEQDGTIKAQGEEVKQMYVDGKEFFGRDPQIAAKNLPAKSVDKVQVFDKKSDMAEFTGIDDGQEEKAINIELKEAYKQGAFGSIEAGYGTQDRYSSKINLNRFGKNQQMSLIGMLNNVNQQGFSMNDYVTFAGGIGNLMRSSGNGGRVRIASGNDNSTGVPISAGLSDGFVNTGAGGINLNQDFGKETRLNLSYFYSDIRNDIMQDVSRENIVSEASFFSEEKDDEYSANGNHRINLTFDHKFDSTQNIRVRSSLAFNQADYEILSNSMVFGTNGNLQNTGLRDNRSEGNNTNFSSEIIYRKRFAKKGRSFSTTLDFGKQNDTQDALLRSVNEFFDRLGDPLPTERILQDQYQSNDQVDYGIQLSYTEPIGKNKFLGLDYSRENNSNELEKDVYDVEDGSELFNSILSNHYHRDYIYDKGDVSLRWIKNSSNLDVALSLQKSSLQGQLLIDEVDINRNFTNLLPRITWNFDITNSKRLRISYNTNVREPSLTQLQPIVDNSNPLNIYIGNPDLLPEYSHRLQLRYFSFSQFSMTNLFAVVNATYTDNAIVNARTIDEFFRQQTTPVNVDNDYRISSFLGFGTPIKFVRTRFNVHGNFTYNRGRVFVNQLEEQTNRYTSSLDARFDNQDKDVFDLAFGSRISYSLTDYSVSTSLDQKYLNHSYYGDATVTIKNSWTIGSRLDYSIYSGGTFIENRVVPIWEASLAKYLFKKRGQLKISAFDILNRNVGIQQNINLNYLEDIRINSLGQYFMMSFSYALNPMLNRTALPGRGHMHIMRGGRR